MGFRPCLRCRPETAPGTPAWEGSPAVVRRALRLIAEGKLDEDDVEAFAARLGVGGRHLRRLFEAHLGASPAAVARASRAHFARRLLDETDLRMTDVALSAGFRGVRQFNGAMRAAFKASPRELRARRRGGRGDAAGLAIRLAYRPPLDWSALLGFFALRATPGVEVVDALGYRRTLRAGSSVGTLAVRPEPESRAAHGWCCGCRRSTACKPSSRGCGACSISTRIRCASAASSDAARRSRSRCERARDCASPAPGMASSWPCAPCSGNR